MSELLTIETVNHVSTVILNRPGARNALNGDLCRAIIATFAQLSADTAVHVAILTGADPAFCAGVDLKEFQQAGLAPVDVAAAQAAIADFTKPLIAAINGPAITGGLEVALACDFMIASERAVFADTHTRVGVLPGGGLSVRLPQAIGVRRAREMSFTGSFVTAAQALEIGLVNHVVAHDELLSYSQSLANSIVDNKHELVVTMKDLYGRCTAVAPGEGLAMERDAARLRREQGPAVIHGSEVIRRGRGLLGSEA